MSNKKISVIINPNAKKFRTGRASLDSYMKLESDSVRIYTPGTIIELDKQSKELSQHRPDYICIAGGDGTLHVVLSSLINSFLPASLPPVLILKEGTMDNVARTIQLKGRGPQLLKRLIQTINNNKEIELHGRSTMKINDKYCFLFGTGFVTNFLVKAYSGKEKGFIRNIQVALMCVSEALTGRKDGEIFREMNGEIFIDGRKIKINPVQGLLAGSVEHIGMGFSPLPEASKKAGSFQVIVLGMQPPSILLYLNKLRTGKNINSAGYLNCHAHEIILRYNAEYDYTMDGDLYRSSGELKVELGPVIQLVKV